MHNNDNLSLTDLGCSAALITAGYDLISLDRSNPHKIRFVFSNNEKLAKAITSYWADKLKIKARTFVNNIRMLKNCLHSDC